MTKFSNLFKDLVLPAPGPKRLTFKRPEHPIWTENKAKLIERYLYYFVMVAKHGAYIDGFAAPQAEGKPESWAAKLVLESRPARLRDFWLCDVTSKGAAALRELVRAQPEIQGRTVEVIEGDFNEIICSILSSGRIKESTAAFCLLDQRTFECEWRTVERIAKHKSGRKIEAFYFLGTGWLDRSLKATKDDDRLRRWWGKDDWKSLVSIGSWDRVTKFCDRFKSELGYTYVTPWPIYSKVTGGRVMYYMIHATDHEAAPVLMARAYRQANEQRESVKSLQYSLEELGMALPEQRRPPRGA
jgi:three-Cys-motif partner protein